MALSIEQAQDTTGNMMRERGSDTQQTVPRPGLEPQGRCNEDKASVDGTRALPTELNGAPKEK